MNTLAFRGAVIRDRDEHLCLTDMWKAAGGYEVERPAQWARQTEGRVFVEYVAASLNLSVDQVFCAERGRAGGTWAHWQIALAYAKYLSADFHMWCNEVVRAHMEGRHAEPSRDAAGLASLEAALQALAQKVADLTLMADARMVVMEFTSLREVLDRAGAKQKGRRALQARLSRAFHDRARLKGIALRRNPHSAQQQWLFPIDFVKGCMADFGALWVAEHNDAIGRQGVLPFKKPAAVQQQEEARV